MPDVLNSYIYLCTGTMHAHMLDPASALMHDIMPGIFRLISIPLV